MSKAWVFLLLLCLVACHVEGRGGGHGGGRGFRGSGGHQPWWQVVLEIIGGMIAGFVALGIIQCICRFCCKACCGCDCDDNDDSEVGGKRGGTDVEHGNQRSYLYQGASHRAFTTNYSSVEEGPATTGMSSTYSPALEPLLPGQRVTVQMVDEQLNNMDLPPTELTLTNLNNLLADLSLYSGLPDVQGVLIKSNHSSYVVMTDLREIPRGNLKLRAVMSGNQHMLRIYPEPQVPSSVEEGPATVTVQMVDEQLNKTDLPPAEVTLTNLNKLLADLSYYSGLPNVQGVFVKSKHSGYVELTDLREIPRGNLKVRAVMSGNQHMLRIYPEPPVPD